MNIVNFIYQKKPVYVTGGHIYEKQFIEAIDANPDLTSNYIYAPKRNGLILKLIAPIRNIAIVPKTIRGDISVFNSASFGYFLLPALILRLMNKRVMVIHHHFLYREMKGWRRWVYKLGELSYLRTASHILTPSPYIQSEIKIEINRESILCPIPFAKPDITNINAPRPGQLLYVGTIESRKGLHHLIESLKLLKTKGETYHLDVVGKTISEAYKQDLISEIQKEKLDVTFHGFVSSRELDEMWTKADIFVFPSLLEGFGMAINEAMAHGLPVISFDNSAMPYSVKNNNNGILVSTGDVNGFADAISNLTTDRELRSRLSQGALEHAKSLPGMNEFRESVISNIRKVLDSVY